MRGLPVDLLPKLLLDSCSRSRAEVKRFYSGMNVKKCLAFPFFIFPFIGIQHPNNPQAGPRQTVGIFYNDLAESDLPYTHGLMNKEDENYEGKEILILGGGDGALLWELLKEKPKFVTMIDIDDVVMESCRKYMRSVCGDCMDNYDGPNYKIIVGDAIAYMKDYIEQNKSFDYVFGDLTDVPISPSPRGELWDFIHNIINLGTKLLKPGTGKYMTHAIGSGCESALKMFEDQFSTAEVKVSINRTSNYVPSFMENWCFYQATRKS